MINGVVDDAIDDDQEDDDDYDDVDDEGYLNIKDCDSDLMCLLHSTAPAVHHDDDSVGDVDEDEDDVDEDDKDDFDVNDDKDTFKDAFQTIENESLTSNLRTTFGH